MTIQSSSAASAGAQERPPPMDRPDFLSRVAERLRAESGSDLPLSCFIEQVKLQLAGGKTPEELDHPAKAHDNKAAVDCFRSWAMPE
ncbi:MULTISPECIES: hypothetical protein [unclassified Rhizobium]|uniref:hypothetical protein n=1 Tax=unclassified Rhizobium TaxID=2613769 RepID=UPI000271977F|nr:MULTISPECIES: hypothetical protein [unclassified Rhizobium]EJL57249.1 hypothetical protein PMI09_01266 [Rhizobium sp. CF122]MBB3394615.1 hypothetical protein [Rhizobium sp. BK060]TCM79129.1 hypothetical protein EV291_104135 [Rhizobium sp. BK068]